MRQTQVRQVQSEHLSYKFNYHILGNQMIDIPYETKMTNYTDVSFSLSHRISLSISHNSEPY